MLIRNPIELIIKSFIVFYVVVPIIFMDSCKSHRQLTGDDYDALRNYSLQKVSYDTIATDFFYEDVIDAYVIGDAIVKGHGFVKANPNIAASYISGYYIASEYYLTKLAKNRFEFHYDSNSISTFLTMLSNVSFKNRYIFNSIDINPYCGSYYRKYHLKIEAVPLGKVYQMEPVFKRCEEARNVGIQKFRFDSLSTYIITKVFEAREE